MNLRNEVRRQVDRQGPEWLSPRAECSHHIRTKDQRVFTKEQDGYEGGLTNPMSWDRTVEKFHWVTEAFADEDLRNRLIRAVQQLDTTALSDLMDLLAQVRPNAVFPTTRPRIQ